MNLEIYSTEKRKSARFLLRPVGASFARSLVFGEPLDEVLLGLLRLPDPTVLCRHLGERLLRGEEENPGRALRSVLGAADRVADEETIPLDIDHRYGTAVLDATGLPVTELVVPALDRFGVLHVHPRPARNGRRIALLDLPCGSQRGDRQNHPGRRNDRVLHLLFLLKVQFHEALVVGVSNDSDSATVIAYTRLKVKHNRKSPYFRAFYRFLYWIKNFSFPRMQNRQFIFAPKIKFQNLCPRRDLNFLMENLQNALMAFWVQILIYALGGI